MKFALEPQGRSDTIAPLFAVQKCVQRDRRFVPIRKKKRRQIGNDGTRDYVMPMMIVAFNAAVANGERECICRHAILEPVAIVKI